jgi:UDP-N-acetylmuramoylalanine--D-glutamate ligase
MLISELQDKKVLIYGAGREGLSAIKLISGCLPETKLYLFDDKTDLNELDVVMNGKAIALTSEQLVAGVFSSRAECNDARFDIIIKSPGVSLYREFFQTAIQNGVVVTSGTNLFLADILSRSTRPKLIGITGTKGKSTTSALVHHFLTALGKRTILAGNIGVPLLDLFGKVYDYDYVVCEISSFQATDLAYSFDVALLNNLYSEHLDWHLTEENYQKDKSNIFLIINSKAGPATVRCNYCDTGTKKFLDSIKNVSFFNIDSALHVKDDEVYDADKLIASKKNIRLCGEHNLSNIAAAAAVLKVLGEDLSVVDKSISAFKPLKHRLEIVCEKEGVMYVNDSISTTPVAAVSALNVFQGKQITILVGGYDRGLDFSDFVKYLACTPSIKIVCLPETGKRIYQDLYPLASERTFLVTDMAEAMLKAKELTPQGGIILLSPAAPSFNAYKNYEERGDDFKSKINS